MTLLDHRGRPVDSRSFRKAEKPKLGPAYAQWGADGQNMMKFPLGGLVQFNLDNLGVQDFRAMRDHYQVNASLAVLSFMLHQSDWHIECENKKIAEECDAQLREVWTPLNRALSTANWSGYSPNLLEWKNDMIRNKTVLDKIKDLIPDGCEVHWKEVDAWMPDKDQNTMVPGQTAPVSVEEISPSRNPKKVKIYDGIKQIGTPWHIPVSNTLWYPLLMENGDYKGKKLLKAAFQSWYFSILIHLFANRYYERFGEPIVVGRAPFEDYVRVPGSEESISGISFMLNVIKDLRSRSVVTLPADRVEMSSGRSEFEYGLEYLESQMRGSDWEKYLTRLDEEISIGLFTPILLLRTADVGSYNLGVGHMQMYLWMLNAMNDDRKLYIDKYILSKMVDYNFSPNAPRAKIKFRKLGNQNLDIVKIIIQALMSKDKIKLDIQELGEISGMTMEEIQGTLADPPSDDPVSDPSNKGEDDKQTPATDPLASSTPRDTAREITARIASQVQNHVKNHTWGSAAALDMGFQRRMETGLYSAKVSEPQARTAQMYSDLNGWITEAKGIFKPQEFVDAFARVIEYEVGEAINGRW